ncbi:cysteine hydrolase [Marinomonas sp.]|nr:isochorismatase family cysteine hydrolase [Marinomonas sp.]MDB4838092.1 cysteine hydrolase [Marinomonas sp.]
MKPSTTAILLIGYQNDYFSEDGILHGALEDSEQVGRVLDKTMSLLQKLKNSDVLMVATPIIFAENYPEMVDPIGILKIIKDNGAFLAGTKGSETLDQIKAMNDRVLTLPGKRGLSCFSNTDVHQVLLDNNIEDVIIAGAVTSLCIDSGGREAAELGYRVHILQDCTVARTEFEHDFYAKEIMPMYAKVWNSPEIFQQLEA